MTGVQTCALPIYAGVSKKKASGSGKESADELYEWIGKRRAAQIRTEQQRKCMQTLGNAVNNGQSSEDEAYGVPIEELRRNSVEIRRKPIAEVKSMIELGVAKQREEKDPSMKAQCDQLDRLVAARLGADKENEVRYRLHIQKAGPYKLDPHKLNHVEYEGKISAEDETVTPYIASSLFTRFDKNNIFKCENVIGAYTEADPMAKEDVALLKGQRLIGSSHTELHKINSLDRWDQFLDSMKSQQWRGRRGSLLVHIRTYIIPPAIRHLGEAATLDDPIKSLRYLTNWRTLLYNVLDQDKQEKYSRNMRAFDVLATENPRYITGLINRLCRCADTDPGEAILTARRMIERTEQYNEIGRAHV